jgi:glutathione synthase/RimK-type ligase-like ATP-grasp enzyme
MTILIISEPQDVHTQSVMAALARMGEPDVRILDFRDFPQRMTLAMYLKSRRQSSFGLSFPDGQWVPMESVKSVWWRRPQGFGLPATGMDPLARHFAMTEAATAFQGMWQASDALWINDVVRDAAAAHKPWQLEIARQIDLAIPDTLITNDPDRVRGFLAEHSGNVVYKPFLQTYHSWRETRLLSHSDLAMLESVRLAPVIFQQLVPGVADLRVTVIGTEIFAAAADLGKLEYKLDVRLNQQAYDKHELPAATREKLLMLMRRLGLEYGAIDLRLTPEGEYVFFEVNPAGQFLFVEHACGHPIAAALAAHLARGKVRASAAHGSLGPESITGAVPQTVVAAGAR